MEPDDDAHLLDLYARAGDESAFAELVRRHLNLVYAAATRRVGDRHVAEDVTQAVFLILAKKPHSARATTPLSAWLLTTVRYCAANALKIERRRRRHESTAASEAATSTDSTAASPDPSDVLVWHDLATHLDDALLKLPALDRQAVLLRYFEAKPVREIARAMNTTEGAAKQRLTRSLDKLRHRLARHAPAAVAINSAAALAALLTAHALRAAPTRLFAITSAAATTAATTTTSFTIAKGAMTMMTFTKIKAAAAILAAASLLTTGLAVTANRNARAADAQPPAAIQHGAVQVAAENRVKAAQDLLDSIDVRIRGGEPLTLSLVDLKASALRHLAEAKIDAAGDRTGRVLAAEQYVQQCRELLKMLEARREMDVSNTQLAQGKLHLANAEYLLAKLAAAP